MTKFRTAMTAAAMAALLTGSQAMAADGPQLAPGKPSGVLTAQRGSHHLLLIGGAVLVVVVGMRWLESRVRVPGLIAAGGAPMAGH